MPDTETDEPRLDPLDDTGLAQALIDRKERGEDVDMDILTLLQDMERVGSAGSEAYVMLDAYRPPSEGAAEPAETPTISSE